MCDRVDSGDPMKTNKKLLLRLSVLVCCAGVMLLSASCVTSTSPDGAVTERVDPEAVNPWLDLTRDLFAKPAPVTVEPEK